jgi:hypothetical protein
MTVVSCVNNILYTRHLLHHRMDFSVCSRYKSVVLVVRPSVHCCFHNISFELVVAGSALEVAVNNGKGGSLIILGTEKLILMYDNGLNLHFRCVKEIICMSE